MSAFPRDLAPLRQRIHGCSACQAEFAATHTAHKPRPVSQLSSRPRILICGQAPGARVHASGKFFDDRSGDRLREWLGVDRAAFYDPDQFAILPMAFCFPGYDAKGSDLPPPRRCADLWREESLAAMPQIELTLLIGQYAQRWHLGRAARKGVTATVQQWERFLPSALPLPHPSWRNTAWLQRNPWFEADVLPVLRQRVSALRGTSRDATSCP